MSRPSLVIMRMPGWFAKSVVCCRELEALAFLEEEGEEAERVLALFSSNEADGASAAGDCVQDVRSGTTGETLKLEP
jgi:hypothetical protein